MSGPESRRTASRAEATATAKSVGVAEVGGGGLHDGFAHLIGLIDLGFFNADGFESDAISGVGW